MQKPAPSASELRIHPTDLLDDATFAKLRRRSDWKGLLLIAHAWTIIIGAMALFAWQPNVFTYVLAVMLIGSRQLGLSILMHDAAHNALMKTPERNRIFGDWLCAFPVLSDTRAYRHYHLRHHAHTQQPNDPDLILSAPFPISRLSFLRKMWRDLSGQTAFHQRLSQIKNVLGSPSLPRKARLARLWEKLGKTIITQVIIFALCALVFHWSYYFILWVLPFFTWFMVVLRVRNIAEHAMIPDANDPFRHARTTYAGPLARLFLAPYWVNYHLEHHLIMYLPCYQLPALHNELLKRKLLEHMETAKNYWHVLMLATSEHDDNKADPHKPRKRVQGDFTAGFEPHIQ